MHRPPRVFLLSPARLDGARGRQLFHPVTLFPVARQLRTREGCPLGEVFRFVSGLYFRGKLAYGNAFARAPEGAAWMRGGTLVITQNRGLVPESTRVCLEHLEAFASTNIHASEAAFRRPFERDARMVAEMRRLQRRVKELEAELEQAHTADLAAVNDELLTLSEPQPALT